MSFTWSCNLSILTPRYFTEFDGYELFPVISNLVSSEGTFIGDLKITSSLTYLHESDLYHQQIDALAVLNCLLKIINVN